MPSVSASLGPCEHIRRPRIIRRTGLKGLLRVRHGVNLLARQAGYPGPKGLQMMLLLIMLLQIILLQRLRLLKLRILASCRLH
jgi:hypothetical protein